MFKTGKDLCYFFEGHVSYKPGHKLSAWVGTSGMITLNMVAEGIVDATGSEPQINVAYTRSYNVAYLLGHPQRLMTVIRGFFTGFEAHERDEWFKVDGKPVRDPHKEETA